MAPVSVRPEPEEDEATISTLFVWPVLEAAREKGLALEVERFGLDPDRLHDPEARVSLAASDRLLQHAVASSGRPDFPLVAADRIRSGHFGLLELLSHFQPTLGEAIATLEAFGNLLFDGVEYSLERGPTTSTLKQHVRADIRMHPPSYDYSLATLLVAAREQMPVPLLTPISLHLPYAPPRDDSHLRAFFGCPVEFDSGYAHVVLPTRHLDVPMRRASPETRSVLESAAHSLLQRNAPEPSFTATVRERIRKALATGTATSAHVARGLHMSERSLRRRLHEEQTSFRQLLDEVRHEVALECLETSDLSTEAIAELLQFSTPQAFHRAFRKWTGMTVSAARHQLRTRRS